MGDETGKQITYTAAVVDDESVVCRRLSDILIADGFLVESFTSGKSFLKRVNSHPFHLVLLDIRLPDISGIEILNFLVTHFPSCAVVMISGWANIEIAVDAVKKGAYHFLSKPFKRGEIQLLARSVKERVQLSVENTRLAESLFVAGKDEVRIVGASPAMQEVFMMIRKVAPIDCNVLLLGDSGTGKELVARAIHHSSPRRNRPFVSFNCGAFTEELITSELFGHERGAFTGATHTKIGLLESAAGGTVFLDEIGEMPSSMQVKLLRAIQERTVRRVGGTRLFDLDIRIIAASNKDLKKACSEGFFREDLFYRLNVVNIRLPRLKERKSDIPLLVAAFIRKYNEFFGKRVESISKSASDILMHYDFPGNVRELENIIQRAVALCETRMIEVSDLPEDLQQLDFSLIDGEGLPTLEEVEMEYIKSVLKQTGYNKALACKILNIPRTTLWRKMKKYGIHEN